MDGGEQAGGDQGGAVPAPSSRVFDAVVVGAGISGLVAAYRLQCAGLSVQVVEAAARAGGVIGSVARDGCLFERGPNSALDTTPLIGELVAALGLGAQMHFAAPTADKRYVVRNGVLTALPASPAAFFSTRLFSASAKLSLLRELFVAPSLPEAEESIAAFVRRRLGTEFLDYAIDPFVAGIYAGDPEQISVRAAFPRLHALEQRWGSLIRGQILGARERKRQKEAAKNTARSFSFAGGMQQLTDALAAALGALALKARVTRLRARRARACSRCRPSRTAWPSHGARARCCWRRRPTPRRHCCAITRPMPPRRWSRSSMRPWPPWLRPMRSATSRMHSTASVAWYHARSSAACSACSSPAACSTAVRRRARRCSPPSSAGNEARSCRTCRKARSPI